MLLATTNATSQIWLKPKPFHIDENFDDFLAYLRNPHNVTDPLYRESINLLQQRVDILAEQRFSTPFYRHAKNPAENIFNVKLCGAWLLAVRCDDQSRRKLVMLMLINNLLAYCLQQRATVVNQETQAHKSVDALIDMALSLLTHKVPAAIRLSWNDIMQDSVDLFLINFLTNTFPEPEDCIYENKGALMVADGTLKVLPCPVDTYRKDFAGTTYVANDLFPEWNLDLVTHRDLQLKGSRKSDILALQECTDRFVDEQGREMANTEDEGLKEYYDGDVVPVEVVESSASRIILRTIDPAYKTVEGPLLFDESLKVFSKYYPRDVWPFALYPGIKFHATVNPDNAVFDINCQFLDFLEDSVSLGHSYRSRFRRQPGQYRNREFWTEKGNIIIVRELTPDEDEEIGDVGYAMIAVDNNHGSGEFEGCLYGHYEEPADLYPEISHYRVRLDLVKAFVRSESGIALSEADAPRERMDTRMVKEFCWTLNAMQSRETSPVTRFRYLCLLKILCEMAEFSEESQYVSYLSRYLRTLILFAQTRNEEYTCITPIPIPEGLQDEEAITHSTDILDILSLFARDYTSEINQRLMAYIDSDDALLSKTASLVQAYNRLKDVLEDKTLKGIKRQILNGLSVITQGDSTLELSNELEGLFGSEDDMKEFKESFFEAPRTAKEQRQHYTIFKCICGMMNNRGGELYLGVNDRGIPVGVDRDLQTLARKQMLPNLDQYMLTINRMGEDWFGETIWRYVTLKPISEYNVVRISIEPYPYDVVSLKDGMKYLRKNNSTDLIQDEETVEDIRLRRLQAQRKTDDKIVTLQDAILKKRKVRLLGYHSSNSESISNRVVEPFYIDHNEYVMCYEHPEVKLFKISRIDKVAMTDEPWTHKSQHRQLDIDIFHMVGTVKIPVHLELKMGAKNALCDLCPQASGMLTPIDHETWSLHTFVYSLVPLRNFYLNNAPGIRVVEAPGLIDDVRRYIAEILP